ncbi:phycobilisome linker polypeptide [Lyngbya sp. PCC 8106]|uniref:phycobilisome linker polypeptide n=1 Tax=Lyngbya sp. (strain PCC 8106) TaxID=313612 RepID=UPI0000EA9F17|nr:phycobilisome linker polypeptide [Lyngbya sp. PCC 8106]EAW39101.1 phycocyanin-associated 7.8kDa rod linker protein [Lyngbya sp. PCC 8106]
MFGQSTLTGRTTLSDNGSRMYRIEVEAMRQNVDPDTISYPIRKSSKTYITVPYSRMSEQLKRINRMGGKILSIEPLTMDGSSEAKMQATAVNQTLDGEGQPKSVGADDSDTQE